MDVAGGSICCRSQHHYICVYATCNVCAMLKPCNFSSTPLYPLYEFRLLPSARKGLRFAFHRAAAALLHTITDGTMQSNCVQAGCHTERVSASGPCLLPGLVVGVQYTTCGCLPIASATQQPVPANHCSVCLSTQRLSRLDLLKHIVLYVCLSPCMWTDTELPFCLLLLCSLPGWCSLCCCTVRT